MFQIFTSDFPFAFTDTVWYQSRQYLSFTDQYDQYFKQSVTYGLVWCFSSCAAEKENASCCIIRFQSTYWLQSAWFLVRIPQWFSLYTWSYKNLSTLSNGRSGSETSCWDQLSLSTFPPSISLLRSKNTAGPDDCSSFCYYGRNIFNPISYELMTQKRGSSPVHSSCTRFVSKSVFYWTLLEVLYTPLPYV